MAMVHAAVPSAFTRIVVAATVRYSLGLLLVFLSLDAGAHKVELPAREGTLHLLTFEAGRPGKGLRWTTSTDAMPDC